MKTNAWLSGSLVLAIAIGCLQFLPRAHAEPYVHQPSGAVFPDAIAGMRRDTVHDFEPQQKGAGIGVKYQAQGMAVDVYVYTAGVARAPSDINHPMVTGLRQQTEKEIRTFAGSKGIEVSKTDSSTLQIQTDQGRIPVLYDAFLLTFPRGGRDSHVWLWPARGHFFKVRITRGPGDHYPQIRDFIQGVVQLSAE